MKAHIVTDFSFNGVRVYFYTVEGDETVIHKKDGEKIEHIRIGNHQVIPEGSESMILSGHEWQALLREISEQKLNPHKEGQLEGKVDALQAHLEDMRTLVFKPRKTL